MDKLTRYQQIIQNILTEHARYKPSRGDIECQLVFDTEQGHYQVVDLGWDKRQRVYGCLIHVDILDGKFWIQYDGTEYGVANELLEAGVPKVETLALAINNEFSGVEIVSHRCCFFFRKLYHIRGELESIE